VIVQLVAWESCNGYDTSSASIGQIQRRVSFRIAWPAKLATNAITIYPYVVALSLSQSSSWACSIGASFKATLLPPKCATKTHRYSISFKICRAWGILDPSRSVEISRIWREEGLVVFDDCCATTNKSPRSIEIVVILESSSKEVAAAVAVETERLVMNENDPYSNSFRILTWKDFRVTVTILVQRRVFSLSRFQRFPYDRNAPSSSKL
jgi:hypothetical protein